MCTQYPQFLTHILVDSDNEINMAGDIELNDEFRLAAAPTAAPHPRPIRFAKDDADYILMPSIPDSSDDRSRSLRSPMDPQTFNMQVSFS